MTREISDFLKMNDVKYKENFKLSLISPIKIGGQTAFLVYPKNANELIKVANFLRNDEIKHKIVGRISNLLFLDKTYDGVIIKTDYISRYDFKGNLVEVDAGISLPYLAKITADAGLEGLEELSGIPGSIGGAIRGNAGAFGREISDLVSDITVYNTDTMNIEQINADKIDFTYRSSGLSRNNNFIISAKLALTESDSLTSHRRIREYREKRLATQPSGQPSLGSVFKRPAKNISAAKLIDDCGLKGKRIGGAQISEKHAGFIVNCGGATASEYLELADYARDKVYNQFGVMLEREIEVI